jgi:UDP-N-acetyl-2-amino-2-deoxyglucuronate dehydrogenase
MNKKIKIAIIGCGRIAVKHFEAIKKHSDSLELVAVCDTNPMERWFRNG